MEPSEHLGSLILVEPLTCASLLFLEFHGRGVELVQEMARVPAGRTQVTLMTTRTFHSGWRHLHVVAFMPSLAFLLSTFSSLDQPTEELVLEFVQVVHIRILE